MARLAVRFCIGCYRLAVCRHSGTFAASLAVWPFAVVGFWGSFAPAVPGPIVINLADRHYAVAQFSRYLKLHVSRYRGMAASRIERIVSSQIRTKGHHRAPQYYVPGVDVTYVNGSICRWNYKGGFFITIL